VGILLGLLTALTWGGADFVARFATRRVGTPRTMLYMQATGLVLLTICLPWLGGWGHLADGSGWRPWAWGLLGGCINACATLCFYRSFEIGKIAVVGPLSASYPALTLVMSWLGGDHLTAVRVAGIILTLLGMAAVAGAEQAPAEKNGTREQKNTRGIGWAMAAAFGFAILFWLLGTRIIPRVGAIQSVWMIRFTCTLVGIVVVLLFRQPLSLPRGEVRWMALGMGFFDTAAFVMSNRGMEMEHVAVISVLGSLYGAVTVGLAAIFLRERISLWQGAGIVAIFAGIFLISK
jgi:drug/metabolite transporter (DMT)-like permease